MSKVCAAKYVVSRKTLAQGVVRKSTASASAPIASSSAADAAATAKLTPAYANNTADNVVQHAGIESPQMNIVYAAKSVVDRKTRAS